MQGPTAQSLSCAQLEAQTVLLQFSYGEQLTAAAAVQVPLPLHVRAGVADPLEQVAAAHVVSDATCWQTPPAAQLPVLPQAPFAAH